MNNVLKKMGKVSSIMTGIGIILAGLIILAISTYIFVNYKEYNGKTKATIVEIQKKLKDDEFIDEEDYNEEDLYEYTVYVDYKVDDKEYKHIKYDSYSSSMKEGNKIEIKYDLNDPSKIQSQNGKSFIIIFIVIGGTAVIFGIYETIRGIKMDKDNSMYNVMK